MGLTRNSCLYECQVMHLRLSPKKHGFVYDVFMFYLDLDELDALSARFFLFSRNRFNLYAFRDDDHLRLTAATLKENIREYLGKNGVRFEKGRIMLLTNLRTLGYVFNPVSFYFCFDEQDRPVCAIAEVGNTFREMKPFLIGVESMAANGAFRQTDAKYFYVSPFAALDLNFEFQLGIPGDKLDIRIDSRADEKVIVSSLTGRRAELGGWNLFWFSVKYPLITLKVIFLIEWNALLLYLKGVPYHRKAENPSMQRGVHHPHSSLLRSSL